MKKFDKVFRNIKQIFENWLTFSTYNNLTPPFVFRINESNSGVGLIPTSYFNKFVYRIYFKLCIKWILLTYYMAYLNYDWFNDNVSNF